MDEGQTEVNLSSPHIHQEFTNEKMTERKDEKIDFNIYINKERERVKKKS